MNFYSVTRYLEYVLFSRHGRGHGIHSPFVFNLITKVLRNKINSDIVSDIEKLRHELISDQRLIRVTDYGSGAARSIGNLRKVSEITRYSSVPMKYGILLANMSSEFGGDHIVEFGTSMGISSMYLASGCQSATVSTIEGCPEISAIAEENFGKAGINNIKLYTGSFKEILTVIKSEEKNPGLVFIDGDHRKKSVVEYFNEMADISDSKTVFILDDIHYSCEMGEAWEVIKKHKRVSITIDIFRMGIVFFREGMPHFDFIIRY
jgi:predicted O-methyltransferase YrrM